MPWEISPVSIIFWKAIRRNWQKRSNDWKRYRSRLTNAKEEVGKPFTKEEELNQKLERLSELNALLNMDEREDTEAEQSESKEKEERPARGSIHEKLQIYKEKKASGKARMAGKIEKGTSVWNKKTGKMA